MPRTGILTAFEISERYSRPRGLRPFLQSVANICPAIRYDAPNISAVSASEMLWTDTPIVEKSFIFSLFSTKSLYGKCISALTLRATSILLLTENATEYLSQISLHFMASLSKSS